MTKKIFITGSTKGPHGAVLERFNNMVDLLQTTEPKTTKILLPTVVSESTADWNSSIRSDITNLMMCSELHLMSNWQGHKRSEILRDVAIRVGIKPHYH